jgi:hypothetical protein
MLTLLLTWVVAQAPSVGTPPKAEAPSWGAPLRWTVDGRTHEAWLSPVLVAEPSPSDEGAAAVRRADATAQVVAERPRLRLWRVTSALAVRRAVPSLVEVVHDLPSTASRARVPVGLVCAGERLEVRGLAALERAAQRPGCVPDLWSPGFRR